MKDVSILAFAAALLSGLTAVWASLRGRHSIPKWSFVLGMIFLAVESFFLGLAVHTDQGADAIQYWQRRRLFAMSFLPGVWLLFSFTYARGNAREFLVKWNLLIAGAFLLPALAFLSPKLISIDFTSLDPSLTLLRLQAPGLILYGAFLLSAVLVLMNLERTFRAAVGTMRWRIKFMILGVGALFAVRIYTGSQALLWPGPGLKASFLALDSIGLIFGAVLMMRSLARKSEEVAVYPSFALLGNSLVVMVAGVYLLIAGLFAKVVQNLGGAANFQPKTFLLLLVLVGFTVAGMSDRVRLHLRRFLSRYLQRPLYDYRTVWRSFTEAIASRVRQEDLCEAAVKQVADIFQALSVSVWLLDEKRENLLLAASTALTPAAGRELAPTREETARIIRALQGQMEPKDIETSKDGWAETLRRCHPTQFRTGGSRVAVGMAAGPQLMGVMTLGDRVGGIFFSLQDFDLLKCVGDQVAAGLLNVQLSQKLLQAKELEAFQTMSAFFVHDLKNTASTLNLMLQNLPVHFDNPAFRQDALRGVATTCDHINHLITRLSLLRHDLQIHPTPASLNDVVERATHQWTGTRGITLVKSLPPGPSVLLDKEQFLKVVTNLFLNATEAVPAGGQVTMETSAGPDWAVLSVTDNGCGMAPEFLRRTLFRPFQTTKKNGFGIGMFQSKMIVEAHGGRIEVESELKKGTIFRVLLPLPKSSA